MSIASHDQPPTNADRRARVIVCGNEKGGSGKSTMAVHIAIELCRRGRRVATLDLDSRQLTLTRYLENRKQHIERHGCRLRLPPHMRIDGSSRDRRHEADEQERLQLQQAIQMLHVAHDFIVVDTPGFDTNLSRVAHTMADTLVTPMNDSFIDYDVLARLDPETGAVVRQSQYAAQVRAARRQRSSEGGRMLDWVVVRNRLSTIGSRNQANVHESLRLLGMELGFRVVQGVSERVVYRELFAHGLTVMDEPVDHVDNLSARASHDSARDEIERLVDALNLGDHDIAEQREKARHAWLERFRRPRATLDIFAE